MGLRRNTEAGLRRVVESGLRIIRGGPRSIPAASAFRRTVLLLLVIGAAACDRTDTSNTPVTTTSPAGTSTAPSSASAKHRDEALVRVVNAAPSGNLDLFAGDLLLFDGLAFKTVTPYRAIDGQRYAFALRPAGMTQAKPLASNTEGLTDGSFYTAVAMPGDDGRAQLRIVSDQLDNPASGKARLRVIHAGTNAGQVLLRQAGTTDHLLEDVDYRSVSGYRDVGLINGTIEVVGQQAVSRVLATVNAHLEAGRFYTIVLVAGGPSTPGLEAFLIEDALSP
jgi:hypothetical protein